MNVETLVVLSLFWVVFFRKFLFVNPWVYATSEPLDTAFPSSRILGEWYWKRCKGEVDPYYYPYYTSIPFLSSFYPPHVITSILGSKLSLNLHWILYCLVMILHFLWASIGAYHLLGSIFGAVTLAYMGYNIKQNSCIIYTVAWTPWLMLSAQTHDPWLFWISVCMGTLAGYWTLWAYLVPLCGLWWLFS